MVPWLKRLVMMALVAVAIRWLVDTWARRRQGGGATTEVIGGDTWPPVPLNPDQAG